MFIYLFLCLSHMSRKLTEQKVLEGLIVAHINNLEYMLATENNKKNGIIFAEKAQITIYMARYKLLNNCPKFWEYFGKIGSISDKYP
jgi:hypothetical protein